MPVKPYRERVPYRTKALYESKEEWKALKEEYLEARDPTEYLFAVNSKVMDGGKPGDKWKHWKMICKSPSCKADVAQWREELAIKIKAEAIRDIHRASKEDKGFQAAKYMAEKGWTTKRGRPSKEDIEHATKVEQQALAEVDDLFQSAGQPEARLN